jgi:glutamate N-acetyltransferase/amino-acid N-acetyltransferase
MSDNKIEWFADSPDALTQPLGFAAAATYCGIKKVPKRDLAVLCSQFPCSAAWSATKNQVVAAPVLISLSHLKENPSDMRALVLNSGNANAVTGERGLQDAYSMCTALAESFSQSGTASFRPNQTAVMSTGVIGEPLPISQILNALPALCQSAEQGLGGAAFADAMLTTDTCAKFGLIKSQGWTMGGAAKGSGMIHPNMATMLAVITTDAKVDHKTLQSALDTAVRRSFNRISVDGDTSTNDMVLVLANGASGVVPSSEDLQQSLDMICTELAKLIVRDGEGATKFVTIQVTGATDEDAAEAIARTVATSPLVKTSWFGEDANWGRILAAAGRAGTPIAPEKIELRINGLLLLKDGTPLPVAPADGNKALQPKEILVELDLGQGTGTVTYWTCDMSADYVRINSAYRT